MKLINHVLDIRRLIQQAFDNRFSRMGLRAEAPVAIEQLQDEQLEKRKQLDNIMANHLLEFNGDYPQARLATINECVFTLFNRIAAIKVMESKELFPEIIRRRKENAGRSFEHNAWLEMHPEERRAEREGLKHFLTDQFDLLGENIPLYRSDYPYALLPTADELNEIIDQFNGVEEDADCGEDTWKQDDILGWLYENFNAVEKEALKANEEKTEYNKVSLQSQVYTPQWVVKFLVDNTLGKSYLEMFPDSQIRNKYKIANVPDHRVRDPKELTELKVLDPACGSGNFLIYAFTLLYDLYMDQAEHYGKDYSRREIPKLIVEHNLFGVDLDERAAQISQIALFIKARELGGHRSKWPAFTNVVSSHFYLVDYEHVKDAFESIDNMDQSKRVVMKMIWEDLSNAYKFGSLVRVDETMQSLIRYNKSDSASMFAEWEQEDLFSFRNQFMSELHSKVNEWGKHGSNAYTLAQTNDAISFLQILSQKYDVVVANPPYTDSANFGPELKDFVDNNYKKPYKFNINLYATFIKRSYELATDDGKIGMIHPMTFMYIKTFEDVRKFMLENMHINLFVEYGLSNLFGSIMVDPAFYVLEKTKSDLPSTFISLDQYTRTPEEKFKKQYCLSDLDDICAGRPNSRVYTLPQSKLKGIKSYPFIYWISDEFRSKFKLETIEEILKPAQGAATTNNNRFLRYWWEVSPETISIKYSEDKKKWVGYSKGGPFNKWYGNNWLLVDWENDGYNLKNSKAVLRNSSCYFKEGITYSASGSKGTSFRLHLGNSLFDTGGSCIFMNKYANLYYSLAFMNSILSSYITACFNPTVNTQVGDMQRIPFVVPEKDIETKIASLAMRNVAIKEYNCRNSIIENTFVCSPIKKDFDVNFGISRFYDYENAILSQVLLNEAIINGNIFSVYGLNQRDRQMVLDKEGIPVGDLPVSREAKAAYREWLQTNEEFKATEEVYAHLDGLEEREDIAKITDFENLYQNNNGWEEFCIKHNVNPVEAWYQFKNAHVLPPQRTQVLAFELLTDVIRTVLAKDDDGIIPLSDKLGEERLALRIEREFMERGYSAGQFSQVCQLLGCNLEKYLQERFFQQLSDHLNLFMYLPKTPFIWHLTSGEHHALELYISIYKWSRDALYRVRSIYAANQESSISARLNSLDTSKTEGRLEAQELKAQLDELKQFCQKVDDLLASGYDPKLDDGVGKNIAPLQKRKMLSYEVLNAGQLKKYLNADW
jgi:type I restriction-modification system DNA methylase subunit